MAKAFFAGSFNPFTAGHASIVERALPIFPEGIVIAVGINANKQHSTEEAEERRRAIAELYGDNPLVTVTVYSGLTVEAARQAGADVLLRGARTVSDFEYELNMADVNRRISGMETVLLFTLPEHTAVSSSIVRELKSYGADVSQFLPHK